MISYRRSRRFHTRMLVMLLALTVGAHPAHLTAQSKDASPPWHRIGDGVDIGEFSLGNGTLFSSTLTIVRVSPLRYKPAIVRATDFTTNRSTVREIARNARALACVNGNFFDESGKALGLLIARGTMEQPMHQGGRTLNGVFQLSRRGAEVVARDKFSRSGVLEALQAGPRLVSHRVPLIRKVRSEASSQRAGVCIDEEKRILLFGVFGSFSGATLSEVSNALPVSPIDCVDALNLDGGGSAQLFVNPDLLPGASERNLPDFEGHDEVPAALCLFAQQVRLP